MRNGARHGRRWSRAAAWTMLAVLPMAAVAAIPFHAAAAASFAAPTSVGPPPAANVVDGPTVDALLRGSQSDLFGFLSWDGTNAQGSFVQFSFSASRGLLGPVASKDRNATRVIVEWATTLPYEDYGLPVVEGPIFIARSANMTITAHDDPTGLIEFRNGAMAQVLALRLNGTVTDVQGEASGAGWPQATLAFTAGGDAGRLFLGAGSFQVNGSTVLATMPPNDVLVLRLAPPTQDGGWLRSALLGAFASGRLAAEFGLVSKVDGGWVENSARYRRTLESSTEHVRPGDASIRLNSTGDRGGLLLLAFDPATMPHDADHRVVVTVDGAEVPEGKDAFALLYGSLGPEDGAVFVPLDVSATALLAYLPSLGSTTVHVASVPAPPPSADYASEAAAVAALALVSVAAAVMFRRPDT